MRGPRVYGSALDEYRCQNNYLNNSYPKIGGGCEFHAYTGARLAFIHGKIIILIILNQK